MNEAPSGANGDGRAVVVQRVAGRMLFAIVAGVVLTAGSVAAQFSAVPAESLTAAIERRLEGERPSGYAPEDWTRVQRLYAERQHRAFWTDTVAGILRLRASASVLLDSVTHASRHGLAPGSYAEAPLQLALADVQRDSSSTDVTARTDVLLTAAFVAYATDMLSGQIDPRSVNRQWHIDPRNVDLDSAIASSLERSTREGSVGEVLAQLRPQNADYAVLLDALARYRQLVAEGGWPRIALRGVLRPGDTTTAGELGPLMSRLFAERYIDVVPLSPIAPGSEHDSTAARGTDAPVLYTEDLASAVAEYQRRHELTIDSIVGPNTLASLNRTAEYRLSQIAANLERHRWLPRERGDRYVLVNVPAFQLRAYDSGRPVLTMNVVVGADYGGRSTPVFSDSMSYVVFRPYWNVPEGIARRELWPKQRRDPDFFRRNDYEVVEASWGTYVRQRPTPENALGRVKFIFPNDYNIYLHDTPAKELFAEGTRAFSHGCIRVEHPDQLAEFVLASQGWDIDRVRHEMSAGANNHRVNLERKLPVYIVYFTAYARNHVLFFGNDIYDRDDALVRNMLRSVP